MMDKLLLKSVALSLVSACLLSGGATAQTVQLNTVPSLTVDGTPSSIKQDSVYARFTPRPQANSKTIDFSMLDAILSNVVVNFGPSTRIYQRRPRVPTGSRITTGHKSAFRLEGKRIIFSYLDDDYISGVSDYRKDLQEVASKIDLSTFSRDQQLAFWFNLHNVAMIEQIGLNYPVKRPRDLRIDVNGVSQKLHDAKFMTVKGVPLSLRDIREKIVYPNWDDPNVIYGFFHGDIGGPAVQEYAFNPSRLSYILESNANEFVNSLRGVRKSNGNVAVSEFYMTEGEAFFNGSNEALKAHLLKHANEEVRNILLADKAIVFARPVAIVADLAGGDRRLPNLALQSANLFDNRDRNVSPDVIRLLEEAQKKYEILLNRGVVSTQNGGAVEITDIETSDENEEGSLVD